MSTSAVINELMAAEARQPVAPAQRAAARVVGFLYLFQMAVAVFGDVFVRGQLVMRSDATATAQNIHGSELLFRLSIAGDLVVYTGVIVLAWAFYVMVRPVNRNLALLALILRLAETAVLCAATIGSLIALKLISGADYLNAFAPGQLHSLALLIISAQGSGMLVGFILLGLGSSVFAWLLLQSGFVPKAIAAWGIFASLLLSGITLITILFPDLGTALGLTYMLPMGLYEVGLGLWLLIKGIQAPPVD